MAFLQFDDLARVGLKRAPMKSARIVVRSEFSSRTRPQTIFRFSCDLVERAGWIPGKDRIQLQIDPTDMCIVASRSDASGYKLTQHRTSRPYVKFTVAKGMPIAQTVTEVTEIIVHEDKLMFFLPKEVRCATD